MCGLLGLIGQLCVPLLLHISLSLCSAQVFRAPGKAVYTENGDYAHAVAVPYNLLTNIVSPSYHLLPARRQLLRFAGSDRPVSELSRRRGSRILKGSNRKPTAALLGGRTCGSLLTVSPGSAEPWYSALSLLFTPLVTLQTLFPLLACKSVDSAALLFQDMQGRHLQVMLALVLPSFLLNVFSHSQRFSCSAGCGQRPLLSTSLCGLVVINIPVSKQYCARVADFCVFSVLISVSVVFVSVQWRAYFAVTEASWVVIGRSVELLLHFRVAELYCGQYL